MLESVSFSSIGFPVEFPIMFHCFPKVFPMFFQFWNLTIFTCVGSSPLNMSMLLFMLNALEHWAQYFFKFFFAKASDWKAFNAAVFSFDSLFSLDPNLMWCQLPWLSMTWFPFLLQSELLWILIFSLVFYHIETMWEHLVHVIIFIGIKWSPEMGENKLNLQILKPSVTGRILVNNESFCID